MFATVDVRTIAPPPPGLKCTHSVHTRCSPCPSEDNTSRSCAGTRSSQEPGTAEPLARWSSATTFGTPLVHSRQPMIVVHSYPASHPAHRSDTGYLDSRVT